MRIRGAEEDRSVLVEMDRRSRGRTPGPYVELTVARESSDSEARLPGAAPGCALLVEWSVSVGAVSQLTSEAAGVTELDFRDDLRTS